MAVVLRLNGKRIVSASEIDPYRETITVISGTPSNDNEIQGPVLSGTAVTLPTSGSYEGKELQIKINGVDQVLSVDYNYVGTGSKTQVSFVKDIDIGDIIEFYIEVSAFDGNIYREKQSIVDDTPLNGNELQGPISAGTPVTLPNSGSYIGDELQIKLNGVDLIPTIHYNYVGDSPRTQVSYTFDLEGTRDDPDVLEYYKES